ncbi:MAG: DUF6491 family protein [Aquisalinus sp.]|nr:DUF6491 family protein [Aquisalinus sp.]
MKNLMVVPAACALALGACASSGTDDGEDKVAAALAGFEKTGETESCLSLRRIDNIEALDDRTLLVRAGRGEYYLNETNGKCSGASRMGTSFQYETSISQLCRGEIIKVIDRGIDMQVGACGLGNFQKLEKKSS